MSRSRMITRSLVPRNAWWCSLVPVAVQVKVGASEDTELREPLGLGLVAIRTEELVAPLLQAARRRQQPSRLTRVFGGGFFVMPKGADIEITKVAQ
jgi:hypothetical protein